MAGKQFLGKVTSRLCIYPLGKNLHKIALSHTVIEINTFLHLTQKFRMAAKNGGKNNVLGKWPVDFADILWVKNFVEITRSHTVIEINVFLHLTQKFRKNYSLG